MSFDETITFLQEASEKAAVTAAVIINIFFIVISSC